MKFPAPWHAPPLVWRKDERFPTWKQYLCWVFANTPPPHRQQRSIRSALFLERQRWGCARVRSHHRCGAAQPQQQDGFRGFQHWKTQLMLQTWCAWATSHPFVPCSTKFRPLSTAQIPRWYLLCPLEHPQSSVSQNLRVATLYIIKSQNRSCWKWTVCKRCILTHSAVARMLPDMFKQDKANRWSAGTEGLIWNTGTSINSKWAGSSQNNRRLLIRSLNKQQGTVLESSRLTETKTPNVAPVVQARTGVICEHTHICWEEAFNSPHKMLKYSSTEERKLMWLTASYPLQWFWGHRLHVPPYLQALQPSA